MHPFYSGLTDSVPYGPRFRWMWSIVPFDVGRDSIPCGPGFRQVVHDSGDNQNADRFPAESWTASRGITGPLPLESPDRFPWNHRTTSTGIRTQLQCQSFRRRSARWNSPQAQCQRMCSRRLGSSHVSFSNPMAVGFLSRKSAANERQSKTCTNLRSMAEKSVTRI
jgi:hypothetical protein